MSGFQAKKIIIPVDFSDFSMQAVDRALEIASDDSVIRVVHVLLPLSVMEPGVLYGEITDETRVETTVKHLQERFADAKYAQVSSHAMVGDPGHEITGFAASEQADLIVMPSHGHGFLKHLMLGSVAERVVRMAHCPVLVLKAK
jgi:nucleotide-binding universal stress UspA family protein